MFEPPTFVERDPVITRVLLRLFGKGWACDAMKDLLIGFGAFFPPME